MIEIKATSLKLHPDLTLVSPSLMKKLKRYLLRKGVDLLSYCKANHPQVMIDTGWIYLISKHHVYLLLRDLKVKLFLVEEVDDSDAESVIAVDKVNVVIMETALLSKGETSPAAMTHKRRRIARQVCPLCGGPLSRQKGKDGQIVDGVEMFEVHCRYSSKPYKSYSHMNCMFSRLLEKAEFDLFKKNSYPTSKWLIRRKDNCPKCKDAPLYERRMPSGKTFHICPNVLDGNEQRCNYEEEVCG